MCMHVRNCVCMCVSSMCECVRARVCTTCAQPGIGAGQRKEELGGDRNICICICIYMYVYVYVYICICICIDTHTLSHMPGYIHICTHTHTLLYTYMYTHTHTLSLSHTQNALGAVWLSCVYVGGHVRACVSVRGVARQPLSQTSHSWRQEADPKP